VADEYLYYEVVDALEEVAKEVGKTVAQVALNRLRQRPSVSTVIVGARNEEQLRQDLAAEGWNLSSAQGREVECGEQCDAGVFVLASATVCGGESGGDSAL
jgi:aryl-alcohol dehydrogenase-like predicted oxidoreductase